MIRIFLSLAATIAMLFSFSSSAFADTCFICNNGSSSTCSSSQYCRSKSGKDTADDRKKCEAAGCKIGGTSSCPTAANVKVCTVQVDGSRYIYASAFTEPTASSFFAR